MEGVYAFDAAKEVENSEFSVSEQKHDGVELASASEVAYEYHYSFPILDFRDDPQRFYHFHHQFKKDLQHNNCNGNNNFLKGTKWYA